MAGYTYTVSIGGRDFDVDSDNRLSNEQAYGYAKQQYDQTEAQAVAERRKTAVTLGPEGFRQSARETMDNAGDSWGHMPAPVARFRQGAGETMDRWALGTKGLFTDLSPEEKQRLAQNKVLSQEGGLASMAGQISGDLAITAPLTIAGGAIAPAVAPTLGRALPQWAARAAASAPARAAGAVATGGGLGAVSAPENRAEGAAWGAGGSVVGGLPRAVRAIVGGSGNAGVAGRAAGEIAQGTGRTAAQTAEELANRIEQGTAEAGRFGVPVTAAQAARSPELAAKELGVRAALPEEFAQQARSQNEAIYEAMRRATRGAESVEALDSARDALTGPMRERALEVAASWPRIADPILEHLNTLKASSAAGNPDVQKLIATVEAQLNQPGGKSAGQLYELEKWLRKKLTGPNVIGDETQAAVRGAQREVMGIRAAIDNAIDTASGGQWTPYKQAYASASRAVDDAVAGRELREAAGAATRPLVGDAPQQTGRTLARDVARAGEGDFGNRFGAPTARELDDLVQFVRRIEEPMKTLKLAGTGGGGSQTTMQAAQLVANIFQLIPGGSVARAPIMAMVQAMRGAEKEQLAHLLLNPEAAVEALRRSAIAGAPLSRAEEVFRQVARAGGRIEQATGAGDELLRRALVGAAR